MARWLLLAALGALACSPCGVHEGKVWLPQGSPGRAAQDAWGMALSSEPTFAFLPAGEVDTQCRQGGTEHALGCFLSWDDGRSEIVVRDDLDAATRAAVVLHEIGHAIRPDLSHITQECEGVDGYPGRSQHVMCLIGRVTPAPTGADLDWALSPVEQGF